MAKKDVEAGSDRGNLIFSFNPLSLQRRGEG
jgi:hypothetical protein